MIKHVTCKRVKKHLELAIGVSEPLRQEHKAARGTAADEAALAKNPTAFHLDQARRLTEVEAELEALPATLVMFAAGVVGDAPSIVIGEVGASLWDALTWGPRKAAGLFSRKADPVPA